MTLTACELHQLEQHLQGLSDAALDRDLEHYASAAEGRRPTFWSNEGAKQVVAVLRAERERRQMRMQGNRR